MYAELIEASAQCSNWPIACWLMERGKLSADLPLGARTPLVAPGITTSNKKLYTSNKGIATRSKDAII